MANTRYFCRYDGKEWLELWIEERKSMLETISRNIEADIRAGYPLTSKAVTEGRALYERTYEKYKNDLREAFKMIPAESNRWAYMDLKARGWID